MQHTECYTERFIQWCLTKQVFLFTFLSNLLLSDGRSKTFSKPIKSVGRSCLTFINERTTLNNRSLPTSMTGCIESWGTGDISSSNNNLLVLTVSTRYQMRWHDRVSCLYHLWGQECFFLQYHIPADCCGMPMGMHYYTSYLLSLVRWPFEEHFPLFYIHVYYLNYWFASYKDWTSLTLTHWMPH